MLNNSAQTVFADINLARRLERTEARSNASFVEARARMFPASGAQWIEAGGAYAMFDGTQSPLTQTFGLGVFEETTDAHLDEIEAFFGQRGAAVNHEISPLAGISLLKKLHERGYQPIELSSVMFQEIGAGVINRADVSRKISTRIIKPGEEKLWARTSAAGWAAENEGLVEFLLEFGQISAACAGGYAFLAEKDEQPICAGMLFIDEDVALLAGASTVPDYRRQGAQTALLAARLEFAAAQGCRLAMMGASPGSQSQKNAERNGFRIAYTRTKWILKS